MKDAAIRTSHGFNGILDEIDKYLHHFPTLELQPGKFRFDIQLHCNLLTVNIRLQKVQSVFNECSGLAGFGPRRPLAAEAKHATSHFFDARGCALNNLEVAAERMVGSDAFIYQTQMPAYQREGIEHLMRKTGRKASPIVIRRERCRISASGNSPRQGNACVVRIERWISSLSQGISIVISQSLSQARKYGIHSGFRQIKAGEFRNLG